MAAEQGEAAIAEIELHLQAVAREDLAVGPDPERGEIAIMHAGRSKTEILVRAHAHPLRRQQIAPRREADIDVAAVIAVEQREMAVAVVGDAVDVIGEEGLQARQRVDLLQHPEIGLRLGQGERRHLALVVLQRDRERTLDRVALVDAGEMEQRHGGRRVAALARREAMARQQVLDVEGADAQFHAAQSVSGTNWCDGVTNSSCAATVRISREPASLVRLSRP